MPTSYLYQLNTIVELIVFADPKSVLDVGFGYGKYGFLCREYLGLRDGHGERRRQIDGIESFPGYLTPAQTEIYDRILIGDAASLISTLDQTYDLILLIDILEHFRLKEGLELLAECRQRSRNLLISTPKIFHPQSEMFGNPYEKHRSLWKPKHLRRVENRWIVPNSLSWICFAGRDMPRVRSEIRTQQSRMRRKVWLERMKRPFRAIREAFLEETEI